MSLRQDNGIMVHNNTNCSTNNINITFTLLHLLSIWIQEFGLQAAANPTLKKVLREESFTVTCGPCPAGSWPLLMAKGRKWARKVV